MKRDNSHIKHFLMVGLPVIAAIFVIGGVAVGLNGGIGLAADVRALSGNSIMSGSALSNGAVVSGPASSVSSGPATRSNGQYESKEFTYEQYAPEDPSYANLEGILIQEGLVGEKDIHSIHYLTDPGDGSCTYSDQFGEVAELSYEGWSYEGVVYYAD